MPSYYRPWKYEEKREERRKELDELRKKIAKEFKERPKKPLDSTSVDLGKEIKRLRIEKGITQFKLAELVGTYQSEIAKIESGRHNLTLIKAKKIAVALGKKVKVTIS